MKRPASTESAIRQPIWTVKRANVTVPAYRYSDGRICLAYRQVSGGKLIRETFADEKKAKLRAAEIATSIANGQADILELTSADKETYLLARQKCDEAGVPLHVAIEEWAAARKVLGGLSLVEAAHFYHRGYVTKVACPPTAEVVGKLMGQIFDNRRSSKYATGMENDLLRFAKAYPDMAAVTEEDIRTYLRELKTIPTKARPKPEPVSLRRRDNVRDAIVRLFRFARDRDHLPADRTTEAEKVQRLAEGAEVSTYAPETLKRLLAAVSDKFLPWMLLGAFAGLRTSEIWRLDWSAIKWEHGVIAVPRVVARKVRTARQVPIAKNLLEWLMPYRSMSGPIYPEPQNTIEDLHYKELKRLAEETGIPWQNNALRHSFGSYRLAIVKSIDQVALEMGNSPEKVRQNYNDPKSEKEAEEYFGIRLLTEERSVILNFSLK